MPWPHIEWDDDGYPTEESLDAVAEYYTFIKDGERVAAYKEAGAYLRAILTDCAANCCASYHEEEGTDIIGNPCINGFFSTGGWSGAESIIALIEGEFWLSHYIKQWNRGGHYIFEFKQENDNAKD